MELRVVDVGLDSRMAGSEAVYTYRAGSDTKVGEAYFIPLGPRQSLGFVLSVRTTTPDQLGFPVSQLRPLGQRVIGLDLPPSVVDLVRTVSEQTLAPIAVCLSLATPPGVRERLMKAWTWTGREPESPLPIQQDEIFQLLKAEPITERKGKPVAATVKTALKSLVQKGLAEVASQLRPITSREASGAQYHLTSDRKKIEQFLASQGKKKPAQAVTLMRLQGSETASFSVQEIKALGQVSDATVKALVTAGLLEPVAEGHLALKTPPTPNPAQASAIQAISGSIEGNRAQKFLLYGVTGSGKTEVYLRSAEAALRLGKQVLYLVPEIALTAQVIAQLRERFGQRVAVLHSNMTPAERMENWLRIRSGDAPVVLGPRSALFAPLSRLGLIVVDEEHEASYKQENTPRYNAKRIAESLAEQHQCPVVMGSATPSIEAFYRAERGELTLLNLPTRAASATLPNVIIEDLREAYKDRRASVFSPRLTEAMTETLTKQEQIILFLNRRAFAPFVVCRECGHRFECPRCAVSLAFHRKEKRLRCHHCDHHEAAPTVCPACNSEKVNAFGVGAEKVEEAVALQFPEARVARLDRDIARRKGVLETTLAQFRAGELDVLVGTQMIAKGLDFPRVTLVGVIAADISLNIPDFRASERTFQLLTQVAGRAGRGERPGKVIIQTLSADHPSLIASQSHDYESLYKNLIVERQMAQYPPFVRLVNVLFTGPDRHEVYELSAVAGQRLRLALPDAEILGPVDCSIERIASLWRRHVLIKLPNGADVASVNEALGDLPARKSRIIIDVDPYQLV